MIRYLRGDRDYPSGYVIPVGWLIVISSASIAIRNSGGLVDLCLHPQAARPRSHRSFLRLNRVSSVIDGVYLELHRRTLLLPHTTTSATQIHSIYGSTLNRETTSTRFGSEAGTTVSTTTIVLRSFITQVIGVS